MAQLKKPIGSIGKKPGEWIGSRYVGPGGGRSTPQAAAAPRVVGSKGKKPGEWIGSRYIGPAVQPNQAQQPVSNPINYPGGSPNPLPRTMMSIADAPPPGVSPSGGGSNPNASAVGGLPFNPSSFFPTPFADMSAPSALGSVPQNAPPGFDQTKWNDPEQGVSHKYVGGRTIASGGTGSDLLKDPMFAGWQLEGSDKIRSPQGTLYDYLKDEEGAATPQWTRIDENKGGGSRGSTGNPAIDALKNDGIPGNYAAAVAGGGGADPWAGYGTGGLQGGQSSSFPGGEGDPLGDATRQALTRLLEGGGSVEGDPLQELTNQSLMDRIRGGGQDNLNSRLESITETINRGRRSQTSNAMAQLADRGILGEPGHVSGPEIGALTGIENDIAPVYAQAIRDAMADASDADLDTLGLAAQQGSTQTSNLLNTINSSTAHQQMVARVALDSLSQNMAWNQFLAEFGLKREEVMWQMENGNIEMILPLIQMFAQQAQAAARGYV